MTGSTQATTKGGAHHHTVGASLVEAKEISKRFGATQALDGVSLTVEAGESHGLVGRNGAGKSTLVSILTGLGSPDEGELRFAGEPAPAPGQRDRWQNVVACVYQRPALVPRLSVAENLFLNRQETGSGGRIDWAATMTKARVLLDEWEIEVAADADAAELDIEERQLVEIARALSFGTRFIILDEPTAQLEARAIERLFARIRRMQEQGITFLYISHHLDELYEICQAVTVLRDGRFISSAPMSEMPKERLVEDMVGEGVAAAVSTAPRPAAAAGTTPALRISNLRLADREDPIEFTVGAGELVGLAGLVGSGKGEIGEAIAGLVPYEGEVWVRDTLLRGDAAARIAAGVGFVPEDRHHSGFVPGMGVGENLTMPAWGRLGGWGFVSDRKRSAVASRLAADLHVVASSLDQPVGELSGGNQQKVVMGRALVSDPTALVLIHPTAGVDIASKEALLATIGRRRGEGTGVLLISDELDELAICDRIIVLFEGRIVATFESPWRDAHLVSAMEGVVDE